MRIRTFLFSLLVCSTAVAQKPIKFSEQLTYSYTKNGKSAETSVYLDRKTSTWLFTNDDTFGGTAGGLAFVVAYPSGTYLFCGTDDVGINSCQRYRTKAVPGQVTKTFGKATGKRNVFGKNKYGWQTLTGVEHILEAGRMTQPTYLATVPFNPTPLYAFNSLLVTEFYLPIFQHVNYAEVLPRNQLVVSEPTPGGAKLMFISPTEYFLDLRTYRIADIKP